MRGFASGGRSMAAQTCLIVRLQHPLGRLHALKNEVESEIQNTSDVVRADTVSPSFVGAKGIAESLCYITYPPRFATRRQSFHLALASGV
jgi:hypothetical protein